MWTEGRPQRAGRKSPCFWLDFSPRTSLSLSDLCTLAGPPGTKAFVFGILSRDGTRAIPSLVIRVSFPKRCVETLKKPLPRSCFHCIVLNEQSLVQRLSLFRKEKVACQLWSEIFGVKKLVMVTESDPGGYAEKFWKQPASCIICMGHVNPGSLLDRKPAFPCPG